MRYYRLPRLLILLLAFWLSTAICTPSFARDIALLSIGPRIGFGEKVPFLEKEQKYYSHLADVAALIKLPWSRPLGGSLLTGTPPGPSGERPGILYVRSPRQHVSEFADSSSLARGWRRR
jgi:hypothetical protein